MTKFSSPFMARSPLNQEVDHITGRTQEEQNAAIAAQRQKEVTFRPEYEAYMKARAAKRSWEDTENDFGFGGKKYPRQEEYDSIVSVWKKIK